MSRRFLVVMPSLGRTELSSRSAACTALSIQSSLEKARLRVVGSEAPTWGDAVNRGILMLEDGEELVIIDDDVLVKGPWLAEITRALDLGADIVGAKLRFPDGRLQHAGCAIVGFEGNPVRLGVAHLGHGQQDGPEYSKPLLCPHVTFSLVCISDRVLREVGKIDTEYFTGLQYEDVDYSFRALEAGFKIVYWPGCTATHHQTHSKSEKFGGRLDSLAKINEEKMHQRWLGDVGRMRRLAEMGGPREFPSAP